MFEMLVSVYIIKIGISVGNWCAWELFNNMALLRLVVKSVAMNVGVLV